MKKKTIINSETKADISTKRFSKKFITSILIVVLVFSTFMLIGYLVSSVIMRNDGFTLNNPNKNLCIEVNDEYYKQDGTIIELKDTKWFIENRDMPIEW